MNNNTNAASSPAPRVWWGLRMHRALLPDYNLRATIYWWTMFLMGSVALLVAAWQVQALPWPVLAQIVAGGALAVVAGFFPVRIPGSKNSFVAGEVFIFLLLLMHGPWAAVMASAGEAFVGSYRSSKRWSSRLASPAISALAIALGGLLLQGMRALIGEAAVHNAALVLLTSTAVAFVYFVLNTLLVSFVFTLKRAERFDTRAFTAG